MAKDKTNYFSLVAIVAIIALVWSILVFEETGVRYTEIYGEEANIVGGAGRTGLRERPIGQIQRCTDTDKGKNYYTPGKVYGIDKYGKRYSYPDLCETDPEGLGKMILEEMYCENNEPKSMKPFYCPNGCKNGACSLDIKEQVTCLFEDSNSRQTCYSAKGSCSGYKSCILFVSGKEKEKVFWESTCNSHTSTTTIIDGKDEYVKFDCSIAEKGCFSDRDCSKKQCCELNSCTVEKGKCVDVPENCFDLYDPVCGCDGRTYSNDCYRLMARVPKDYDGECITTKEAYFKFTDGRDTFIFKLTDKKKIKEARDILSGKQKDAIHVMGIIIKEPVNYNPPWSYHLNHSTIEFFENAVEVCDASIKGIEEHLDEVCGAFLPNCRWCPWGSKLIEEVT